MGEGDSSRDGMSQSTRRGLMLAREYFSAFAVARREYPGFARHFGLACLLVGGVAPLNSATPYLLSLAIDAVGQGARQGASTWVLGFAAGCGVCRSAAASMEWIRSAAAASKLGLIDSNRLASGVLAYSIHARDPNAAFGCRHHDVRAAIDWKTWLRRFDDEGVLAEKWLKIRLQ